MCGPFVVNTPPTPPAQPLQPLICVLSSSLPFPECHINGIIWYIASLAWFLSICKMNYKKNLIILSKIFLKNEQKKTFAIKRFLKYLKLFLVLIIKVSHF